MEFELTESGRLDGIFKYCNANGIHVSVDASSTAYGDPQCLIQRIGSDATYWESSCKGRDPFVQFDFGDNRVMVNGYTLVSAQNAMCDKVPTDWLLAGSNDQDDWVIVSFFCDSQNEHFRYIRLQMPELNTDGDWTFRLGSVELFGELSVN